MPLHRLRNSGALLKANPRHRLSPCRRAKGVPQRFGDRPQSGVGLYVDPGSGRDQRLSCVRSSCASCTAASISTRLIDTLSTLMPKGTPSVRQYAISSVAVASACW